MKVPIEWLKEYVKINDVEQLKNAFQKGGFEVEGEEKKEGGVVWDVAVPSNRPDCLGITGLARVAKFLLGDNSSLDLIGERPEGNSKERYGVDIRDKKLCKRYIASLLSGAEVKPSPEYIRKRLNQVGIKTINNIVDITNYVMHETGQPLHAFDLDKLAGNSITVRKAKEGEKIVALDDIEYKLKKDSLVIADEKSPVAIAGVIGGKESSINDITKNILLESAWFDPVSVRVTSRKLGVSTESSARFEHIANFHNVEAAAKRAIGLLIKECGAKLTCVSDERGAVPEQVLIPFSLEDANSVLGLELDEEKVRGIFEADSLSVEKESDGRFKVTVPSFRLDLETQQDLEEEIVRFVGLDSIKSNLRMPTYSINREELFEFKGLLKEKLLRLGYQEVVTLSFTDPSYASLFDHNSKEPIAVQSSMRVSNYLRSSLLPEMLVVMRKNRNIKEPLINTFELSKIYIPESSEMETLCTLNVDGFDGISAIVDSLNEMVKEEIVFKEEPVSFCNKALTLAVYLDGKKIGHAGQISSVVLDKFDMEGDVYFLEIDCKKLFANRVNTYGRIKFSTYPLYDRDVAIIVSEKVLWFEIASVVKDVLKEVEYECYPFDIFRGGSVPSGKKSVAFRIVFYPYEKGFRPDSLMERLREDLESTLGAALR